MALASPIAGVNSSHGHDPRQEYRRIGQPEDHLDNDSICSGSQHGIDHGLHMSRVDAFASSAHRHLNGEDADEKRPIRSSLDERENAAAAAAAAGLPGMLREEEMEFAYDIFCGGEDLDFQRFLTGLGVLR